MINHIKNLFEKPSVDLLRVDVHSHLIPGVDDGVETVDEAIEVIVALQKLGYKKLITTPHIMSHRFPNTKASLLEGLEKLKVVLHERNIMVEIAVASEYYIDAHFLELLEKGEILTFGEKYLLFELSYVSPLVALEEVVYKIKSAGYIPVLAHPERYTYWHKKFEQYVSLKEMGVLFQINAGSLEGFYTPDIAKVAQKLSREGMVDFLGSDTHRMNYVQAVERLQQNRLYRDLFKYNTILNHTL